MALDCVGGYRHNMRFRIYFINQPSFGSLPQGARLERIKRSPHYRDGQFNNLHPTQMMTSDEGRFGAMLSFLFRKIENLRPENEVPVIKTDLHKLGRDENVLIWFGHSSYFIQVDGKRFLVDPVFAWLRLYLSSTNHLKELMFINPKICRISIIW